MKIFSKQAREVLDPGGQGHSFCYEMKFTMWNYLLDSQEVSSHDVDGE